MKTIIICTLAITTVTFAACNSNNSQSTHEGHSHDSSTQTTAAAPDEKAVTAIQPQFSNIDPALAAVVKQVVNNYLEIKNGLAADNSTATAKAGEAMAAALSKANISAPAPEQQKIYTDNEEDLKEHAEHIGKNEGNIAHQREHFAEMSEDVYALVKAFGGGQTLYHDYCSMYNNNKGAWWLSEEKAVKNPYFGSEMPTCGTVKETIQ